MTRRARLFATLFALLAFSATAHAEQGKRTEPAPQTPVDFTDRPLGVDAILGFGTPTGLVGGALEYDIASRVALGVGAGTNIAGLQLAALGRVRPAVWKGPNAVLALELGGAFAIGRYGGQLDVAGLMGGEPDPNAQDYQNDWLGWMQFDIGFELKTRSGFHLVLADGFAIPLNPESGSCTRFDTGAPVACDRSHIEGGNYPALLPTVATVMVGWSL